MNESLLTFKDLQLFTNYKSVNKVIEVLRENGIKYMVVNKGVATTIDAVNVGMGLLAKPEKDEYSVS